MKNSATYQHEILKNKNGTFTSFTDQLAIEEPLEIQLLFGPADQRQRKSIAVTMRTPGYDFDLAAGFLLTEGIIQSGEAIQKIAYAHTLHPEEVENTLVVVLHNTVEVDLDQLERHFYTSSSCGVCGKASIAAITVKSMPALAPATPKISADLLHRLPDNLREVQSVFDKTGGLHAAALFDWKGNLLSWREDVGRHNAVDKLIGEQILKNNLPLSESLILVSGRASFELIQKSLTAGIPMLAAVGAPSSLAVQLAEQHGMTLIGFLRDEQYNVYSGVERLRESKT